MFYYFGEYSFARRNLQSNNRKKKYLLLWQGHEGKDKRVLNLHFTERFVHFDAITKQQVINNIFNCVPPKNFHINMNYYAFTFYYLQKNIIFL